MNRHLADITLIMEMSGFIVVKLRNSPAQYPDMARISRLEPEDFNHNLFDPDLIRGAL